MSIALTLPQLEGAMEQAIEAAHSGVRGANPLVGAALVDPRGEVVALAHHRGAGSPHAEYEVLRASGLLSTAGGEAGGEEAGQGTQDSPHLGAAQRPDDLTLISTLEPCRHHGRQPACTEVIAAAGIRRVVFGAADPTYTAGGGASLLRERGISVRGGILAPQARELNRRWERARSEDRPFVTVHLAQSLDARIAAADGTSQWITGPESRAHTHRVRQRIDAILVGTNTAEIDDPQLTARDEAGVELAQQPLRCVMGLSPLREDARLRQGRAEGQGWLHLRTRDPRAAMAELAAVVHDGYPIRHVLVEGGQSVLSAFFAEDLVDEVFVYHAPLLLGGDRHSLGDIGVDTLDQARHFHLDPADHGPVSVLGEDVCLHLAPVPAPQAEMGAYSVHPDPAHPHRSHPDPAQ